MKGKSVTACYSLKIQTVHEDVKYLEHFNSDHNGCVFDLFKIFPDFKVRVKQNPKTHKAEMCAEMFDIAWYAFSCMVADVVPPGDVDLDYLFSQGSILTCMYSGEYFVWHSSRQRYCDGPDFKAERNNRKARAYYKRKKADT